MTPPTAHSVPASRSGAAPGHLPVMCDEALADLAPADGEVFVDATFGGGGFSRAILEAADCTVWAIDRDPDAVARGARLAAAFKGRLTILEGRFGDMVEVLGAHGITQVDGIVLDLGVSSFQLDTPARGFSFQSEGPLDMRMDASGPSAADAVNSLSERELARIIFEFGEERLSRAVARAIVAARAEGPIETTQALAAIVRRAVARRVGRGKGGSGRLDPATRTFQALRIHVNDELGELDRGLAAAEALLKPGGRLVVISFHSLEDRSVKSFFSARCGSRARPSRHQPSLSSRGTAREAAPTFRLLHRGMVKPGAAEIARNPRARSARLRAAVRTEAPVETAP
ncbi:MAG: 16S rRNA (cytosine(1402)-N(4))-methyltransferase RsmH [Alphaproteobacteria bacterium]|nr:16S rRNA (cytosine(1402)-N(4))-methyltransferase RsmH [Alphaproteobacteria bacterium]